MFVRSLSTRVSGFCWLLVAAMFCSVAFAELQTDMNEIAGEISGTGGIPFRCYSSFCMSVLFPGASADYHPVIRGIDVRCLHVDVFLMVAVETVSHRHLSHGVTHSLIFLDVFWSFVCVGAIFDFWSKVLLLLLLLLLVLLIFMPLWPKA